MSDYSCTTIRALSLLPYFYSILLLLYDYSCTTIRALSLLPYFYSILLLLYEYSCTTIRALSFSYSLFISLSKTIRAHSLFLFLPFFLSLSFPTSVSTYLCLTFSFDLSLCMSILLEHFSSLLLMLQCLRFLHYRELLYGTDYLCVDTYFRSYMDEEGYVPMALLSSYPNIACYAASIEDLLQKLSVKEDSFLEVDISNETVRLKSGWDKVSKLVTIKIF